MKKVCFLLALLLLLSGCSGDPIPTQPTTTEPLPSGSTAPTMQSTTVPTETKWPYNPEWEGCEVIKPEEGVLILHEDETLENKVIDGDVYITANAVVTLRDSLVLGDTYCHGKLILEGRFMLGSLFAYKKTFKNHCVVSSGYDGIHGEILFGEKASGGGGRLDFAADALDYAFETWGKVELTEQPPREIRPEEEVVPSAYDPSQVRILSGKQVLVSEIIDGDVYITSDGDVTFYDVTVYGSIYVYGKLHFSDYASTKNKISYIYAYDFGVTCEAFDGTHGQVTGGPVICSGYVMVANDALDYAFDTWGKQ